MDVAIIGSYPPPHGGQSVHIKSLATYLRDQGCTVTILNTGSNKTLTGDGVVSIRSSIDLFWGLLRGPRPTVAHVHVASPEDYGKLLPVRVAAALRGFPWLVTIHSGDSAGRLLEAPVRRRLLSRMVLRGAARLIAVNASLGAALSLLSDQVVAVIAPYSVDLSKLEVPPELTGFISSHSPIITCVGRYEPLYGFDQAIEAVGRLRSRYPDVGLLLVGEVGEESNDYRRRISGAGLDLHVRLCGNLDHEQCLAVIGQSAVFLRPTQFDGDSLSVREALAMGVPVVASATEFRPTGVALFTNGDNDGLVATIAAILDRGVRGDRLGHPDSHNLELVRNVYRQISGG